MILQKKGTTIKDVLDAFNYDFDYVSYRIPLNLADFQGKSELLGCENTEFAGCFKTENKKIVPLDYDSYFENEEVVAIEEWSMPEENIKHGLTIVVCAELVSAETFFDSLNKSRKAVNIQWNTDDSNVPVVLPTEMYIPDDIEDEDIGDWLSDTTGFLHDGFVLQK